MKGQTTSRPAKTPRERFFEALRREKPDRVPMFELTISPKVIDGIHPGMDYYDFIDTIDHEAVGPNTTWDPLGFVAWVDEEKGVFRDRWGVIRRYAGEVIPVPIEGPIKSREDLKRYRPPDPAEEPLLKVLPELIERFRDRRATFILGRDAWTGSYMIRGMENLLMDLAIDPDMVREIVRINVDYYKEVHRRAIEMGVDFIALVDDYAFKSGPLMSPRQFEQLIYPGLKETVSAIKAQGVMCTKHTDGNIWPIIEMIVDAGVDALGPLEPGAGMDLAKVQERFGDRIAVIGNVDCDLLGRGQPEDIRREVKLLLKRVSRDGGHILSSGNSIPSSTRPENFMAMVNACRELGRYPIEVPD